MTKPIIHAFFICYNEEKMLPYLLKHYSFCDKIFLYDNNSTDRTLDIASSFENVEIIKYDTNDEMDELVLTKMRNNIWKQSKGIADYVIVADCDEFICHPKMELFIEKSKEIGVTVFKPNGYNMVADLDWDFDINNIMDLNFGVKVNAFDKCVMFDPNKIEEMNFSYGSHRCNPRGEIKYGVSKSFNLKHFKFLGWIYYMNKNSKLAKRVPYRNNKIGISRDYSRSYRDHERAYEYMLNKRVDINLEN